MNRANQLEEQAGALGATEMVPPTPGSGTEVCSAYDNISRKVKCFLDKARAKRSAAKALKKAALAAKEEAGPILRRATPPFYQEPSVDVGTTWLWGIPTGPAFLLKYNRAATKEGAQKS